MKRVLVLVALVLSLAVGVSGHEKDSIIAARWGSPMTGLFGATPCFGGEYTSYIDERLAWGLLMDGGYAGEFFCLFMGAGLRYNLSGDRANGLSYFLMAYPGSASAAIDNVSESAFAFMAGGGIQNHLGPVYASLQFSFLGVPSFDAWGGGVSIVFGFTYLRKR